MSPTTVPAARIAGHFDVVRTLGRGAFVHWPRGSGRAVGTVEWP